MCGKGVTKLQNLSSLSLLSLAESHCVQQTNIDVCPRNRLCANDAIVLKPGFRLITGLPLWLSYLSGRKG